ncbi:glycerol-3-phosphate dehydrogenase [Candidatus Schneideria nysicola]|uniref:glycerol-3-phosphate dehydrogenase n=1 Tax=Candidatus Schneideria nysicola TaxID=1081631 RepID=UPI001CAA4E7B|nr:glycerol-3-phosphate dehydrogenase [Candidatus Schneideria nysicola]UAJ65643.1 glycerol-3-phosphate dehydrogenase [Candidatus Schneideria nysicola]
MEIKDLIVIGGGINGVGIAADAAGRGLSVVLLEAQDLASATSSASSKLIHGGLRYLENYEFRLVREALAEREILLKMAPHIISPMRFCLPHRPHLRPAWLIRMGLFIYDHLVKRTSLPASNQCFFNQDSSILKPDITKGFQYSDCWVDDARLVIINAQEIVKKGGEVKTRMQVIHAKRHESYWIIKAKNILNGEIYTLHSKGLVNAAGPWVKELIDNNIEENLEETQNSLKYNVRLIKGSHIVVPRTHTLPLAFILQNEDKRIIFVIPWMNQFSIIGTTDIEYLDDPRKVTIDDNEIEYLLNIYNSYFKKPLNRKNIIWHYSGVRSLYDDQSKTAQKITRDYILSVSDKQGRLPLLSVLGGKITTYRKLAEHAMNKLMKYYPHAKGAWTSHIILSGGNIENMDNYLEHIKHMFPFLSEELAKRYIYTYGTCTEDLLNGIHTIQNLGEHFGHGLHEVELNYLIKKEWAMELDDIIWRRTKLGMWLNKDQKNRISKWLLANTSHKEEK